MPFIDRLAGYGANALWFHSFDAAAFEACARHGIAACVEFPTFRADFALRPELIPVGIDGRRLRYGPLVQGICLSQEHFLAEIEAKLVAGLRAYQPAGIWFDYLTYTGWFEEPNPDLQDTCFCPACIAEFCETTGTDATTPAEIQRSTADRWARHKCERIASFAAHYAGLVRSYLPACLVGAYMCPYTPGELNGALARVFGQDYALLAPAIDVFTPLIYAAKSGRPPSWAWAFLEQAPGFVPPERKVQLILDVLDFPASLVAAAQSAHRSWGIQLFGGAEVFADPDRAEVFGAQARLMRPPGAAAG